MYSRDVNTDHSFTHSGDLYSASSRDYYSEALPAQSCSKKKDHFYISIIMSLYLFHSQSINQSINHSFIHSYCTLTSQLIEQEIRLDSKNNVIMSFLYK